MGAADSFGYGADGQLAKRSSEQHVTLCLQRVESRGKAHHLEGPSPKQRTMLLASAKAAEAPSAEELAQFDARLSVEVTRTPPEMASGLIEELRRLGWLGSQLRSPEELRPRIDLAWQAYKRAEDQWRAGMAAEQPSPKHE